MCLTSPCLRRCGKSCRLRWLNYLRPDIKHGGFTELEDSIICTLYRKLGSRWSIIASQLPGRTDNDVKNYWNTKLKKKVLTPEATHSAGAAAGAKKPKAQQLPDSTTPQLPSPPARTMAAAEPNDDFSTPSIPATDSGGIELICQGPRPLPVAPNFPEPNGYVVSPPHDISAASSSSLTMDSGGGGEAGGYVPWLDGGIEALLGVDDALFTDMGFGCAASDFFTWYGPLDRIGEPPQVPGHGSSMSHISNLWANSAHGGSAQQKLY